MKSFKNMFIILIVLVTFLCMFMCCQQEETIKESVGIESGFTITTGDTSPALRLGYRSDTREFDVDNLVIEVGFGWIGLSEEDLFEIGVLECNLVVVNLNNKESYVVSEIPNLASPTYIGRYRYEDDRIEYAHTEFVKIPREAICGDQGEILITIIDTDTNKAAGEHDVFIYTRIGENRVRIDGWWEKYSNN